MFLSLNLQVRCDPLANLLVVALWTQRSKSMHDVRFSRIAYNMERKTAAVS